MHILPGRPALATDHGAPLGTALALSMGAPVRRLLGWMTVSVALWGVGLTVAATFGLLVSRVYRVYLRIPRLRGVLCAEGLSLILAGYSSRARPAKSNRKEDKVGREERKQERQQKREERKQEREQRREQKQEERQQKHEERQEQRQQERG